MIDSNTSRPSSTSDAGAQPTKNRANGLVVPSTGKATDWKREDAYQASPYDAKIKDSCDLRKAWWDIDKQGEEHSCVGLVVADLLRCRLILRNHFKRVTVSEKQVFIGWKQEGNRL